MLTLDRAESLELFLQLSQVLEVEMKDLNQAFGLPDLYWIGHGGLSHGIEHKTVLEVMAGLDDVEELLSRQYPFVDVHYLLVEGVIIPEGPAECVSLRWSNDGKLAFKQGRRHQEGNVPYRFSYQGWRAWCNSLTDYGIRVIEVPTREALVRAVVALYEQSLRAPEDHSTFRRVIKAKLAMPQGLPQVKSLMGLHSSEDGRPFVGEMTATSLEAVGLGSMARLIMAPVEEIAAVPLLSGKSRVGPAMAAKLKGALGCE